MDDENTFSGPAVILPRSLTWEWGRDDPDGTRIDRYVGSDGFLYERITPKGGPLDPDFQEVAPGCEPVWQRIGPLRR